MLASQQQPVWPMHVILHAGVHFTDEDKILKCLLRNADAWRHEGIAIPGPSKFRRFLTEAIARVGRGAPAEDARDVVLDAILDDHAAQVQRMVLCHPNLFAVPGYIFAHARTYRHAEQRLRTLTKLFHGDQVSLFMGLRDPATFIPAAFQRAGPDSLDAYLNGIDPMAFRWSHLIRRMRADVPEVPITLWCNEDTPLIWGQIIREMAGIALDRKITGAFDLFSQIVSREGMRRFRAFLRENPNVNEDQKRRAMIAFMDKYAIDEAIEEELDLPGWDSAYVDMLTELYEDDLYDIAQIDGVRLIAP